MEETSTKTRMTWQFLTLVEARCLILRKGRLPRRGMRCPKVARLASPGGSEASCPSAIEVEQHIYVPQRLFNFFVVKSKRTTRRYEGSHNYLQIRPQNALNASSKPSISVPAIASRNLHLAQPAFSSRPLKAILSESARVTLKRNHSHHAPQLTEPIPEISSENTYDIVIIGGANAGLAFACALCKYYLPRSPHQTNIISSPSISANSLPDLPDTSCGRRFLGSHS